MPFKYTAFPSCNYANVLSRRVVHDKSNKFYNISFDRVHPKGRKRLKVNKQ